MQGTLSRAHVESESDAGVGMTRMLLTGGIVAGPLYVIVSLAQATTREGFDLSHHAWSLLSNGDLGWVHMTNLILSGLLTVACAIGMRGALRGERGGTWAPWLIGIYGLGMVAAGVFTADPMDGFPRGTPPGPPAQATWHGLLHLVSAGIGFLGLIGACFVLARRFAADGERGWAAFSVVTGVAFLAAFVGIASGSSQPAIIFAFIAAVVLVSLWLALVAWRLRSARRPARTTTGR